MSKADRDERHETDARAKLKEYYSPWLEKFVEKTYVKDLNNTFFQVSPIEIYPDERKVDFAEDKG